MKCERNSLLFSSRLIQFYQLKFTDFAYEVPFKEYCSGQRYSIKEVTSIHTKMCEHFIMIINWDINTPANNNGVNDSYHFFSTYYVLGTILKKHVTSTIISHFPLITTLWDRISKSHFTGTETMWPMSLSWYVTNNKTGIQVCLPQENDIFDSLALPSWLILTVSSFLYGYITVTMFLLFHWCKTSKDPMISYDPGLQRFRD